MAKRPRFLIIALLLAVLDVAADLSYGWPAWKASPGDVWNRGLVVLLATLGAVSLANVWVRVVPAQDNLFGDRNADRQQTAARIPAEARGQANV